MAVPLELIRGKVARKAILASEQSLRPTHEKVNSTGWNDTFKKQPETHVPERQELPAAINMLDAWQEQYRSD
ncbi:hypothetical protein [Paracoccus aerius]|uniref:Uncharacterized protein n=1 Tax=Paracoccus aerius TaxID=1915382 RepID=A0ABS1SAC4_9RHOB|nr:hypothetical protein [Paracoccus aerius]MBL3675479.1 hypothetical protein [Paracoccus aerius]GHG34425.1 hypothetical protein GCM10017322_36640 [Paracoccus aerius]